jgi:predicted MFS family arabinose efflux permease
MWASIAAFNMAMLTWWAQPLTMDALMRGLTLSESRAGSVIAIELLPTSLVSFVLSFFVSRLPLRKFAVVAALGAIACHSLSASAATPMLFAWRAAAGVFEGILMAVSTAALATSSDPDRAYGAQSTGNIIFCSAFLALAPLFATEHASVGLFSAFAIATTLLFPLVFGMPRRVNSEVVRLRFADPRSSILLLLVMVIWGSTVAIPWFFLVDIGSHTRLSVHEVGVIAGISGLGGLLGSSLVTRWGKSVSREGAFGFGLLAVCLVCAALIYWENSIAYVFSVFLYVGCLYVIFPYLFGMAAEIDPLGGLPAAMGAAYILTGSIGAILGGYMVSTYGLHSIVWLCAGSSALCYGLLLVIFRLRAVKAPLLREAAAAGSAK